MIRDTLDERFMQEALCLATKGWGKTGINPLVGAVVVKNGRIVGRGFHRKLGEAHAEVCALIEAGRNAQGATLYVNLEPCCFEGRTPPCVESIIKAGIKRVVIAMTDPNPVVKGRGITILQKNNIEVISGILQREAIDLNHWYQKYITTKRPYVIVKIASSCDGRITGFKNRYITSIKSRRYVHSLRGRVSAVLVGINTVLKDNPYLTDRFVGRNNPARVVLDPHLRIPLDANFLKGDARRLIITSEDADQNKIRQLKEKGIEIILFKGDYYPLNLVFEELGRMEFGSILVEGGGILFSQILAKGLYDELDIFVAPESVGAGIDFLKENSIELQKMNSMNLNGDTLYYVYRHN